MSLLSVFSAVCNAVLVELLPPFAHAAVEDWDEVVVDVPLVVLLDVLPAVLVLLVVVVGEESVLL